MVFLWQFEAMMMSSHDLELLVLIVGIGSNFGYQKKRPQLFFIIFNIGKSIILGAPKILRHSQLVV